MNVPVSNYYLGESGRTYFRWQSRGGLLDGMIESHKFKQFIEQDDVVLDFGCGGGFTLAALQCERRIGVEPNPYAREEAVSNGVEVYGSLAEVPDGIANVAISNHALEHVLSPIEALCELKAKLVPGGKAVICLPMEDWRSFRRYNPAEINHHLYAWNPQLLGNLLFEAGFDINPGDIRILAHCWPRGLHRFLYRFLPLFAFNAICHASARVLRKRQIVAIVTV